MRCCTSNSWRNGAPKVGEIDFVGVPDENTLTASLLSGDIDGSYIPAISTIDTLAADPAVTVTDGPFPEVKEVLGGYWMINVA